MDVLHYNHLLLRRKNAAQSRIQEDTDRALRETEEDLRAEESRVKALANLDHRRQKLRQDLINESLKSVQALKVKHAQEVAALEERHRIAALSLKEGVELQEKQLKEHFDKQGELLNVALSEAYNQVLKARKKEKARLDAKRLLEDNALRNDVFRAFEKEALSEPKPVYTHPISEPDTPSATSSNTSSSTSEPDTPSVTFSNTSPSPPEPDTHSVTFSNTSPSPSEPDTPSVTFSNTSSSTSPSNPTSEAVEEPRTVVKKEEIKSEDVSMLWSVQASQLEPELVPEPLRQPVKFQLAPTQPPSKRQKIEPRLSHPLPAKPQSGPPKKTTFKLKSFSCGGATWHHSADISVKLDDTKRIFEICYGKNSLSAMHPDWVLDGAEGQKSFYNTDENTFEVEREGRIHIWLEFKFAAELNDFLTEYREHFNQVVSMTRY